MNLVFLVKILQKKWTDTSESKLETFWAKSRYYDECFKEEKKTNFLKKKKSWILENSLNDNILLKKNILVNVNGLHLRERIMCCQLINKSYIGHTQSQSINIKLACWCIAKKSFENDPTVWLGICPNASDSGEFQYN